MIRHEKSLFFSYCFSCESGFEAILCDVKSNFKKFQKPVLSFIERIERFSYLNCSKLFYFEIKITNRILSFLLIFSSCQKNAHCGWDCDDGQCFFLSVCLSVYLTVCPSLFSSVCKTFLSEICFVLIVWMSFYYYAFFFLFVCLCVCRCICLSAIFC